MGLVPALVLLFGFTRFSFCVDGQVVHVNGHPSLCDLPMEDHVHHHLKGGWRVGESEEHNCRFEESFRSKECHFPFISFLNADVVVSPSYVELSEEGAAGKVVNSLGNKWGDVAVFLGPTVDGAIILDWMEFAIFLFDEEEVCGIGAPGFPDSAPLQVFSYELMDLLYLKLSEGEQSSWKSVGHVR